MKLKIKSIAAALVISFACAYITVPVGAADKLPVKGEKIHGFTVTERRPFEMLGAELITFEHEKTGARVLFCANDDIDRHFQISFKTPALDDSGLTHIFEHSTLGGSEKYPSSTLFMKLINQTYNTYMNAATSQNSTTFLFSSLSQAQLLSLGDYYLDSVFHPMIYSDKSIFDREAWRYELTSGGDDLTVSGTVYSEMQGASDITTSSIYNVRRTLFPDSFSTHVSGGVPEDMLSLGNDDLIEYHKKYYHPSNSLTIMYGDIDCRDFLKLLDEYFSEFTRGEIDIDYDSFSAAPDFIEQSYDYPTLSTQSSGANSYVSYAIECKGADADTDEFARLSLAANILAGTVENAAEKSMPGALLSCSLDTDTPEPTIIFTAATPDSGIGSQLKQLVDESVGQLIKDGISDDLLKSISLSARRLQAQTIDSFDGFGLQAAAMWAVSDEPDYYFDYIDSTLNLENITSRAITDTLKKYVADARSAVVSTVPSAGLADKNRAEFEKRLSETKSAMSDDEIDALVERTYEYHNSDTDNEELDRSLLDKISVVDARSLPEETREYEISDETVDGVRYVSSVAEINEMGKGRVMLDISDIPVEDLNWLAIYASLIGAVGTEKYSADDFVTIAGQYADCSVDIMTLYDDSDNRFTPYMIFKYDGFSDDSDMIFDIAEQALLKPDFSDTDAIAALAAQYRNAAASITDTDGDTLLYQHVLSSTDPWTAYSNAMGLSLDSGIEKALTLIETDMDAAVAKLKEIQHRITNRRGASVVYSGSKESIGKNKAAAERFFAKLPDKEKKAVDYSSLMTEYESSALIINSSVNYNGLYAPINALGIDYNGGMEVAMNCITDKILLPSLRDGFNAYGAECSFTDDGLLAYSYSDPEIANTFKFFSSLGDIISNTEITQDDVDRYILSVYSDYVRPGGELHDAYWAASDYTEGITSETKLNHMREIKSATPETIRAMADAFKKLFENGVIFTAGSAVAVLNNADLYDNIINPLGYEPDGIKVIINGKMLQTSVPAYIENDRVMLPMRSIFEALGAEVEWNGDTREVTAMKDGTIIVLKIDADIIDVNDAYGNKTQVKIDSPAVIRDDHTMVPLRAVSETLGYSVNWNGEAQTVTIG